MHFINSDLAKIDPERARDCRCCSCMPSPDYDVECWTDTSLPPDARTQLPHSQARQAFVWHCAAAWALVTHATSYNPPNRVVVIEASKLLGSFDRRLRQYAANKLIKSGVTLRRGMVKEAFKDHVVLQVGAKRKCSFDATKRS